MDIDLPELSLNVIPRNEHGMLEPLPFDVESVCVVLRLTPYDFPIVSFVELLIVLLSDTALELLSFSAIDLLAFSKLETIVLSASSPLLRSITSSPSILSASSIMVYSSPLRASATFSIP